MITLNVHSSLEAVGFIAYVAGKLAERGIGTNPVSGFWHDHVFVPVGREGEAMAVLEGIAREAAVGGREKEGRGEGRTERREGGDRGGKEDDREEK
jgi:ACT domain